MKSHGILKSTLGLLLLLLLLFALLYYAITLVFNVIILELILHKSLMTLNIYGVHDGKMMMMMILL